MYFSAMYRLCW